MKKRIVSVAALLMVVMCAVTLAACGGGKTKATQVNVERIDNTMDLAAVEAIIGEASHDLRNGLPNGRVSWNISFDDKKTQTHISIYIDFDAEGKVEKLDARSLTSPRDGGSAETDWEVAYPR